MTFALVAFLLIGGDVHAFELDSGLSLADCRAGLAAGVTLADIGTGALIDLSAAPLACEPESAR